MAWTDIEQGERKNKENPQLILISALQPGYTNGVNRYRHQLCCVNTSKWSINMLTWKASCIGQPPRSLCISFVTISRPAAANTSVNTTFEVVFSAKEHIFQQLKKSHIRKFEAKMWKHLPTSFNKWKQIIRSMMVIIVKIEKCRDKDTAPRASWRKYFSVTWTTAVSNDCDVL